MQYWTIIPAAGQGSRFGGSVPKQYAPLLDRPVLAWSIGAFMADSRCQGVVVAIAQGDPYWAALAATLPGSVAMTLGGAQRSDSVLAALTALTGRAHEDDFVLVHDAARPCLTRGELDDLVAASVESPDGALLASPVADTLKRDEAGHAVETVSRDRLWRAQTPQGAPFELLRRALTEAMAARRAPTDEAQALEWFGRRPRLVEGLATNIKITTAADLRFAEAILSARVGKWPN